MRVGVATLHHGRRGHLERQAAAVRNLAGVSRYLAVSMDGSPPPMGAEGLGLASSRAGWLPLARARNLAVAALADCDLVVLLDADCIPDPGIIDSFAAAAADSRIDLERALLLGPVGWLVDPVQDGGLSASRMAAARASEKRAFPSTGTAVEERAELFWSLCCAVSPAAHARAGGFDEAYLGWGAEDTDLGRRAVRAGLTLWKVAGAWAYHQPHPPARHSAAQIGALAANAARFHRRWGDWPMPDVLAELAAAGQISWSPTANAIATTSAAVGPLGRVGPGATPPGWATVPADALS